MLARLMKIQVVTTALAAMLAVTVGYKAPVFAAEDEIEEEQGPDIVKIDPTQPSVRSGGRYMLFNFPLSELERTLLLVAGVLELRADFTIDMSKGSTFETMTANLAARYGLNDTLELQGGFSAQAVVPENFDNGIAAFVAVEGSIMYDLLDWRLGVGIPVNPDFRVNVFFGLPLKFRILKERVAILAFEKILTIHTHSVAAPTATDPGAEDFKKPDLTLSIGALVQIIEPLALILRAEFTSVGFEGDPVIPLQVDLQYSVSNVADVGLSLILTNLAKKETVPMVPDPPDPKRIPVDGRAINFFVRFRI